MMADANEESTTPLSLDQQQQQEEDNYGDLDERILFIVAQCSNHEIRPARLAADLGISMDDASAELCGLLKAVGTGSSFYFDENKVMVFTFPPDFCKRARRFQRRQSLKQAIMQTLVVFVKMIKIITAFGLILSLLIVIIAAMVGMVAALIAMSRSGHGQHRMELTRRLRSMFYTLRQLLWCYAMFGGNFTNQDPFLQEIAHDLALVSSLCCGNPASLFFWMRASRLSQRRRQRGWALNRPNNSNVEGVSLIQRGTWGQDEGDEPTGASPQDEAYRGLLSVSVEFLFGPTPFVPGPTESEKWKLRAAIIVQHENAEKGISLQELSPYIDSPPSSLEQETAIASEGLAIVSHFNGKPAATTADEVSESASTTKARFIFPELLAESSIALRYEEPPDLDDGSWEYLCYSDNDALSTLRTSGIRTSEMPSSLQEQRYVLSRLEKKQFQQCVILGVLNFIGVAWMRQSLEPGGVLDISKIAGSYAAAFLQKGLMPILSFYSILFFILPLGRFLIVIMLNAFRMKRNHRRADFALALRNSQQS